ncbi:MAG TPA: hypothetical protein VNY31_08320 [Solirubrobacteraceae bacterium]|jgi:hypothetical protein|nr:hypothetical protein [Solirubrobacteraceae bacterium]
MEFALVLRELSRRKILLLVGVLVAAAAAVFSVYRVDGSSLESRSLQYSSANTQVLVDSPKSVLGNLSQSFEPLSIRASVYANFMASPAVLAVIGQHVGLSGGQIYAAGPVNPQQPRVVQEPTALKRNIEITGETNPYRLEFSNNTSQPTINIYAQAPKTSQAIALANAAVVGLQSYVAGLQRTSGTPSAARVTIRQLGPAIGGVVNGGISKALAAIVFVMVFLLWCVLVLVGSRFVEIWRTSGSLDTREDAPAETPQTSVDGAGGAPTPSYDLHTTDVPATQMRDVPSDELMLGAGRSLR